MTPQAPVTVIGGGVAGLVASITAAEAGRSVTIHEAHHRLGGRARTSAPPYRANLGPHVLYDDGPFWTWLAERGLVDPTFAPRVPPSALPAVWFRESGERRRTPPRAVVGALSRRRRKAPVTPSFRDWATESWGAETARLVSNLAGVFSFDADPGRLSAAFVWDRMLRVFAPKYPAARYIQGGWSVLIERMAAHARSLGVTVVTGSPVDRAPDDRPLIIATELAGARKLLNDESLRWEGSQVVLLDVAIDADRGDPFVISDLDASGWVERFSAVDPTLAPTGQSLVQVQVGLRAGETTRVAVSRAEELLECGYRDWRERERWRRQLTLRGRSGALDLPGTSWRDRPQVDRGDGIFLAGDMVAAPGLLSEVSYNSAIMSARLACASLPAEIQPAKA
jgi:phytoene dehydrogenase-like protein